MAEKITILNADTRDFQLLVDGEPVRLLEGHVLQESVTVEARAHHSVVHLALLAIEVDVRQSQPVPTALDEMG